MRQYLKSRGEIFAVASTVGASITAVWFVYRSTETWNYFDVAVLHGLVLPICVWVSFLPFFAIYLFAYFGNRILITASAQTEFSAKQADILRNLISAYLDGGIVERNERDLLEEYAWAKLKAFWVLSEN